MKAENIFYAGSHTVKIGDFGFSTLSRPESTLNTFCGSPPYAAPELFKDEHYYGVYVDVWALGIMLYFMVTGVMPFRADTVAKLKKCILEGTYVIPSYVSDSCQFLVRSILKPIPTDRFSISEIHFSDWLEGQDFPDPMEPYSLNPSLDTHNLSEHEKETRGMLQDLGITEDHLKTTTQRDSRSSITGTYRILLHKVQRQKSEMFDSTGEGEPRRNAHEVARNNQYKPASVKQESKLCVIL